MLGQEPLRFDAIPFEHEQPDPEGELFQLWTSRRVLKRRQGNDVRRRQIALFARELGRFLTT
jgi:hypothetical protein